MDGRARLNLYIEDGNGSRNLWLIEKFGGETADIAADRRAKETTSQQGDLFDPLASNQRIAVVEIDG